MTTATHSHSYSPSHRLVLLDEQDGVGIFEDLSSPYPCRIKCPVTEDYVIPYAERSEVTEFEAADLYNRKKAYEALTRGDAGESAWVLEILKGIRNA